MPVSAPEGSVSSDNEGFIWHISLQHPPNFLIASDLSSHVAPVAVIPEPEPEPAGTVTPETESVQDLLIDTEPNVSG